MGNDSLFFASIEMRARWENEEASFSLTSHRVLLQFSTSLRELRPREAAVTNWKSLNLLNTTSAKTNTEQRKRRVRDLPRSNRCQPKPYFDLLFNSSTKYSLTRIPIYSR